MTIAATDATKLGVAWNAATGSLTLEDRAAAGEETGVMAPVRFPEDRDTIRLGESMLIAPGNEAKDSIVVYYTQRPNGDDTRIIKNKYQQALANNFEKGCQYNVFFKVYNNKPIVLTVELTAWKPGADIEVDSEDEEQ